MINNIYVLWQIQNVTAGEAAWLAKAGELQLFVQPVYGDGVKYKGIIRHPDWVLTLENRFNDRKEAFRAVESMAEKVVGLL